MRNNFNCDIRDKEFIPAAIRTSLEVEPFWGRVTAISPEKIELLSKFEFKKGRVLALGFELGGEQLEDIRGAITAVLREPCGYFQYSIRLSDQNQRTLILEKLLNLIAKT